MNTELNKFFTDRYEFLVESAHNILRKIKRTDLKYELVSECYIYLSTKEDIRIKTLQRLALTVMKNQVYWSRSNFNKNWIYPNGKENEFAIEDGFYYDSDDDAPEYLIDETIDEETHLAEEKEISDKISHIGMQLSQMPLDQRLLYDDIYNKGINTSGKLSRHNGTPRTNCYLMMRDLKENLTKGYENKNE